MAAKSTDAMTDIKLKRYYNVVTPALLNKINQATATFLGRDRAQPWFFNQDNLTNYLNAGANINIKNVYDGRYKGTAQYAPAILYSVYGEANRRAGENADVGSPFDLNAALAGRPNIFKIKNPLGAAKRGQAQRMVTLCGKTFRRIATGLNDKKRQLKEKKSSSPDVLRQIASINNAIKTYALLEKFFTPYLAFLGQNTLLDACVTMHSSKKTANWIQKTRQILDLKALEAAIPRYGGSEKFNLGKLFSDDDKVQQGRAAAKYIALRHGKRGGAALQNIGRSMYKRGKKDICVANLPMMMEHNTFLQNKIIGPKNNKLSDAKIFGGHSAERLRKLLGSTRDGKKSMYRPVCKPRPWSSIHARAPIHGTATNLSQQHFVDALVKADPATQAFFVDKIQKSNYNDNKRPAAWMPYFDGGNRAHARDNYWQKLHVQNKTGQYAKNSNRLTAAQKLAVSMAPKGKKRTLAHDFALVNFATDKKAAVKGQAYRYGQSKVKKGTPAGKWTLYNRDLSKDRSAKERPAGRLAKVVWDQTPDREVQSRQTTSTKRRK